MTGSTASGDGGEQPTLIRRRGMGHAVLSFASTVLVGLLGAFLISRLYGVAVVGEFALASAPYVLVSQLSNLGEQYALVHRLSTERPDTPRSASLCAVVFAFSTGVTAVVAALATPVGVWLLRGPADQPDLVQPALVLMLSYVLLTNPAWNIDMVQSAFSGTGALLVSRFCDAGLLLLASVALAFVLDRTTETLVLSTVLTFACTLLLRLVLVRTVLTGRPTRASLGQAWRELPSLVRFGLPVVPGVLVQGATSQVGFWLVSAVRPIAVVGAYSRANNLAGRLTEAGYRLSEVMLPGLSEACRRREYEKAGASFSQWVRVVALGLAAACAPAAGAAVGLLDLFGPGFAAAALPLALLLLGYAAAVLTMVHAALLLALELPGQVSRLLLLRCVVSLVLVAPLTFALGATGAALSLTLAFLVELAAMVRTTDVRLRATGARITSLPWARLAVAVAVTVAVARLVDLSLGGVVGTVVALLAGLLAFGLSVLATAVVRPSEVRGLTARLPRQRSEADVAAATGEPPRVPTGEGVL